MKIEPRPDALNALFNPSPTVHVIRTHRRPRISQARPHLARRQHPDLRNTSSVPATPTSSQGSPFPFSSPATAWETVRSMKTETTALRDAGSASTSKPASVCVPGHFDTLYIAVRD